MNSNELKKKALEVVIRSTHHQCKFLGFFSSCSRVMGLVCVE